MIDDIYNRKILDFAGNIGALGHLDAPDGSASAHSKLCGSTVHVELCLDKGIVTDFAHEVKACALGQASSAIMARHVVGSTADELRELRQRMAAMLKMNGPPPEGKWSEFECLIPVRDYKARHASTLLTFEAVTKALDEAEARLKTSAQ